MSRTIILAGAPEPSSLDWSEKALLSPTSTELAQDTSTTPPPAPFTASWRQIPTDRLQMRPALPKLAIQPLTQVNPDPAEFFSPADHVANVAADSPTASDVSGDESQPSGVGSAESTNEALSDYYNHSFSIYEALPDTQSTDGSRTPGTPMYETSSLELSLEGTNTNDSATGRSIIRTPSQRRLSQAPKPRILSNLNEIPNARELQRILPQTKTVNLIVAVLSISPTKKVTVGKAWGKPRQVELVELLVADETKSGFTVTMWLPKELHVNWRDRQGADNNLSNTSPALSPADGARSALRRNLKMLKARDIIMLQNVALKTWEGKVAGGSLKGDVTKLDLLHRRKADEGEEEGWYSNSALRRPIEPQIRKVKAVRDWLVEFVGEEVGKARKLKKGRMGAMALPEDTQY